MTTSTFEEKIKDLSTEILNRFMHVRFEKVDPAKDLCLIFSTAGVWNINRQAIRKLVKDYFPKAEIIIENKIHGTPEFRVIFRCEKNTATYIVTIPGLTEKDLKNIREHEEFQLAICVLKRFFPQTEITLE